MTVVLLGIVLVVVAGWLLSSGSKKSIPGLKRPDNERPADKGFYADIDPKYLNSYQSALQPIFNLLNVPHFFGTAVPGPMRDTVERMITDAAANPRVSAKNLRVMLLQFLQADITRRRQEDVVTHWAERVYEEDLGGPDKTRHWIPSAWEIYLVNSIHAEIVPDVADEGEKAAPELMFSCRRR